MIEKLEIGSETEGIFSSSHSLQNLYGKKANTPPRPDIVPELDFEKIYEMRDKLNREDEENNIEFKNKELGSDMPEAEVTNLSNLDLDAPERSNLNTSQREFLPEGSAVDSENPESQVRLEELKKRKEIVLEMLNTTYISDEGEEEEEETEYSNKGK